MKTLWPRPIRRACYIWTFATYMTYFPTNPTHSLFFFNIVHFGSNSSTIWASFLLSSHSLVMTKSISFILWPIFLMWKCKEAFLVDFKNINSDEDFWYVNGVVLSYTSTCCDSMGARQMKCLKFSTVAHALPKIHAESI